MSDRHAAQLASSSDLFGIDTRTLGLFRIVLGTLLLLDGIARAQHLGIHYTDSGIAPLVTRDAFGAGLSLHWLSGGFAFQFGMMASQLAAALALVVGFHARRAAFFCWLLLTSLHFRSPYLDDGGDSIARMMLLWSIFLPVGERFSLQFAGHVGVIEVVSELSSDFDILLVSVGAEPLVPLGAIALSHGFGIEGLVGRR